MSQDQSINNFSGNNFGFNSISHVFNQFDALNQALIDTSSLIYLSNTNLLTAASRAIQLKTISNVVKEFGSLSEIKDIEIIELREVINEKKDTDRRLMETAMHLRLPIISEDKKMLMRAKRSGLPFFNTLMIMNFLIYKNVIKQEAYQASLDLLRKKAYYNAFIFEYGKIVFESITEKI